MKAAKFDETVSAENDASFPGFSQVGVCAAAAASTTHPHPAIPARGSSAPKPGSEHEISPGACGASDAWSRPWRAITPGRKFSTRTSAAVASRTAVARSPGAVRSSTTLRLPRCSTALPGCRQRGPPGGSTRSTSAPWSASISASSGPATY